MKKTTTLVVALMSVGCAEPEEPGLMEPEVPCEAWNDCETGDGFACIESVCEYVGEIAFEVKLHARFELGYDANTKPPEADPRPQPRHIEIFAGDDLLGESVEVIHPVTGKVRIPGGSWSIASDETSDVPGEPGNFRRVQIVEGFITGQTTPGQALLPFTVDMGDLEEVPWLGLDDAGKSMAVVAAGDWVETGDVVDVYSLDLPSAGVIVVASMRVVLP